MDYCLDASAINKLHDDPEREGIVARLLASNPVITTALSIIETAITENVERRMSLLTLQRQLSNDERPLRLPTEILKQLTTAYVRKLPSADLAIDDSDAQFWWILHEPERLSDEDRQEAYKWKKQLEQDLARAHQAARTDMRKFFSPQPPRSFGQLLQFCCCDPQAFLPTTSMLYEEITGHPLWEPEMRALFTVIPEWPLYLAGWAHGMYAGAIQQQNHGAKSNPGTIDFGLRFTSHIATV